MGRVVWSGDGPVIAGQAGEAIYAAPLEGGHRTMVARFHTPNVAARGVATLDGVIYAATFAELVRVFPSETRATVLFAATGTEIGWFEIINRRIIVATWGSSSRVFAMELDGSAQTPLAAMPGLQAKAFCSDGRAIYLTRSDDVVRVPLDATPSTVIQSQLADPRGCAVVEGDVYTSVANGEQTDLIRIRNGSVERMLTIDAKFVDQMVFDKGRLHYAGLGAFGSIDLP